MSADPKTIAFVLYPGLTPLDLVGPLQAFGMLKLFTPEFDCRVVAGSVEPMDSDVPVRLSASATFDDVPNPFAIVVPGGAGPTLRAMADRQLLDYLRSASESAQVVASVCTGSLLLGAAGLLEGRRATTHWGFHRLLPRFGATYVPERWVEDGKFIMSAGVSAGIDMALHLIARLAGEELARQVQLILEYDPAPPFGGIDWEQVDRDMMVPMVEGFVATELAGEPELQERLAPAAV
ncbi:MAG TPA: DJ-1/PfpI family protein [Actinomycetota bacterium]|nr:DJ-1/PfpI family protein [Actinomycetota bacterium]